jgi:hypothetical protein
MRVEADGMNDQVRLAPGHSPSCRGHDGLIIVRAELCERLASLQTTARRLSQRDFNESVGAIKHLAAAYGLTPVVRVADALERAVAEDRGGCPRALYLGRLQDAIGCEAMEESAAEAMLASVSIRLCA